MLIKLVPGLAAANRKQEMTEPTGSDIPEQNYTRRALNDAMAAAVVPSASIIAVLYGLLAILHPFMLPGPDRWVMAALAVVAAVASGAIALLWRTRRRRYDPHAVIAFIAALVALNTALHFLLFPVGQNTSNFVILSLGLGFLMLSRVWYWSFQIVAFVAWLSVVTTGNVVELANWGWLYLFAFFVSLVLHEQRIHATKAVARREALLRRRNRLLQQLVNAEEWESMDLQSMQSTICRTANEELGADATSIWLFDRNGQVVRRVSTDVVADRQEDFFSQPNSIPLELAQPALDALTEERVVSVADIKGGGDAAQKLGDHIVASFKTTSLLLSAIIVSGEMVGIVVHAYLGPVHDWSVEDRAFSSSIADISALAIQSQERALLEERTHQAERLESLGVLAGGVAHDFNNLLTVMIGNAELLEMHLKQSASEYVEKTQAILEAGARAKELARQMLAYAGRASFATKTVDLNELVREVFDQIAPVLLREQTLNMTNISQEPLVVSVDTTQIRQVILNLATNARDAHADHVSISTGRVVMEESLVDEGSQDDVLAAGEYCWVSVQDDGDGMDTTTRQKIFDPFFSTRSQGTGLGLAAALGILRAHDGAITVQSALGKGSAFTLYLPTSDRQLSSDDESESGISDPIQGRVLLVDDEQLLSQYASAALQQLGCDVTAFHSYQDFSAQHAEHDLDDFDMALIDLTLGDGQGTDIVTTLRGKRADLPIIMMSGYDASDALTGFALRDSIAFLQKPFQQPQLLRAWHLAVSLVQA